jgi:hypothetical protein
MNLKFFGLILTMVLAVSLTACQSDKNAEEKSAEEATEQAAENIQKTPVQATNNKVANNASVPAGPTTTMSFEETTFDFGTIADGEKVRHTYEFTNTGSEALIISNCKGSCGCTVPQCPKEPIPPGESGEIVVEYNSRGKGSVEGKNDQKFVTITANTNPTTTRLTIKGVVKKEEAGK